MRQQHTVVHILPQTSDAGGIMGVYANLLTSQAYNDRIERTVFIGPCDLNSLAEKPLLYPEEILFSSSHGIVQHPAARKLAEVECKYGVRLLYGRCRFVNEASGRWQRPEVILIDAVRAYDHTVNALKGWMFEEFGLESIRYEHSQAYERAVRFAPAALAILRALQLADPNRPAVMLGQDELSVPMLLAGMMDPLAAYKTVFWAQGCPAAQRQIEQHSGHDTRFYNLMARAEEEHFFGEELFAPQDGDYCHALMRAARNCDTMIAVSDMAARELRFFDPVLMHLPVLLCPHGIADSKPGLHQRQQAREHLRQFTENLLGYRPDIILSHVMFLSLKAAVWRDLRVLYQLENKLVQANQQGIFYLVATDQPVRSSTEVQRMENGWNWPLEHQPVQPDLSPQEAKVYTYIQEFNRRCQALRIVLINQPGFFPDKCGRHWPEGMVEADLGLGSDVVFAQGIYEPWAECALTAMANGALGVITTTARPPTSSNLIPADYINVLEISRNLRDLSALDQAARDVVEERISTRVAKEIWSRLAGASLEKRLQAGGELRSRYGWDVICREYFLPALDRAYKHHRLRQIA
ncbi:MAG: hypothetical protein JW709_04395 [Sedimentisphaerales bacterium]|nr:hypothetical protein [Sedimentisphaerales bacterium]